MQAKVNLALNVLQRRPDGFHSLDMLLTSVSVADVICYKKSEKTQVTMDGKLCGMENIATRAIAKVQELYPEISGEISIEKHIPVMGGLGGSSADAAGVLVAISKVHDIPIESFYTIAKDLGSDVPYMLTGGFARVEGVGDIIIPLPYEKLNLLLVKPNSGTSTKAVFERYDELMTTSSDTRNSLQEAAISLVPEIGQVLDLLATVTDNYFMSGAGSTCVGIFDTEEDAEKYAKIFLDYDFVEFTKAVTTMKKGIYITEEL